MANNLGFFLGGVTEQANRRRALEQRDRALGQQDRALGQQDRALGQQETQNRQQLKQQVQNQGRVLREQFDALIADPEFDQARLSSVFHEFLKMADVQDANEAQVGLAGTSAATMRARWNTALNASQKAEIQRQRDIETDKAKIAAGVAKDPTKERPQTAAGQTVFDEQLIVDTFGQDSPQHKAFLETRDMAETPDFNNVRGLRQEFTRQSEPFVNVQNSFQKVLTSARAATAPGDMSLIFAYMKMLDPESVVREGEQATAEQARGVPDSVIALYNKAITGEKLSEKQRREFVSLARDLFAVEEVAHSIRVSEFTRLARSQKIDPRNVIIDFRVPVEEKEEKSELDELIDELEKQLGGR